MEENEKMEDLFLNLYERDYYMDTYLILDRIDTKLGLSSIKNKKYVKSIIIESINEIESYLLNNKNNYDKNLVVLSNLFKKYINDCFSVEGDYEKDIYEIIKQDTHFLKQIL